MSQREAIMVSQEYQTFMRRMRSTSDIYPPPLCPGHQSLCPQVMELRREVWGSYFHCPLCSFQIEAPMSLLNP